MSQREAYRSGGVAGSLGSRSGAKRPGWESRMWFWIIATAIMALTAASVWVIAGLESPGLAHRSRVPQDRSPRSRR